jgi:hypothetical protein
MENETIARLQGIGSKPPVFRGNPPSKSPFSVTLLQSLENRYILFPNIERQRGLPIHRTSPAKQEKFSMKRESKSINCINSTDSTRRRTQRVKLWITTIGIAIAVLALIYIFVEEQRLKRVYFPEGGNS